MQELSTTEFIAGIANDLYDENDIVKYCSTLSNIKAFWGALVVEHSRMTDRHSVAVISFSKDAVLTTNGQNTLTPENKTKLERLANAIFVVEDLMSQQECKEPQHGKEKTIEQYITGSNKETTIQAIKSLVCGKKGKQAAVIIAVAVADGYMCKATFDTLKTAFCIDGTKQAFNNAYKLYTDNGSTRQAELSAARAALKRAIEGAG